jgi:hypothetical protein
VQMDVGRVAIEGARHDVVDQFRIEIEMREVDGPRRFPATGRACGNELYATASTSRNADGSSPRRCSRLGPPRCTEMKC